MICLKDKEEKQAKIYLEHATRLAKQSICFRSKCGSVIVSKRKIIGEGFNSPPQHETLEKCIKDSLPIDFKSDKTCCIHAEQRAIIDALVRNPEKIIGSTIYFTRLDENRNPKPSGQPYCTICSKLVLDVGIDEFVLQHENGIFTYNTKEYNDLSFQYRENPQQTLISNK